MSFFRELYRVFVSCSFQVIPTLFMKRVSPVIRLLSKWKQIESSLCPGVCIKFIVSPSRIISFLFVRFRIGIFFLMNSGFPSLWSLWE